MPHICSVQLVSLLIMADCALVHPALSNGLQLRIPRQLLHVSGGGLAPIDAVDIGGGGLDAVNASGLLPLGHLPPQLVVLVQDGGLAGGAELPEFSLGGALFRGALTQYVRTYWLLCL